MPAPASARIRTDGAPLAGAPLNGPRAIAVDAKGNLIVVLREGNAVYRIDAATETHPPLCRHGREGQYGRRRSGKLAKLNGPEGHFAAPDGSFYIADTENHTIRRIDPKIRHDHHRGRHGRARRRARRRSAGLQALAAARHLCGERRHGLYRRQRIAPHSGFEMKPAQARPCTIEAIIRPWPR